MNYAANRQPEKRFLSGWPRVLNAATTVVILFNKKCAYPVIELRARDINKYVQRPRISTEKQKMTIFQAKISY